MLVVSIDILPVLGAYVISVESALTAFIAVRQFVSVLNSSM